MKTIEVVAAVIVNADRILATQRGYGPWRGWWEFPGGKIEAGEDHSTALRREIHEELDAVIEVGPFIATIEYDYPEFHLTMHCYRCSIPAGEINLLEHLDARWLRRNELSTVQWLPADITLIESLSKKE